MDKGESGLNNSLEYMNEFDPEVGEKGDCDGGITMDTATNNIKMVELPEIVRDTQIKLQDLLEQKENLLRECANQLNLASQRYLSQLMEIEHQKMNDSSQILEQLVSTYSVNAQMREQIQHIHTQTRNLHTLINASDGGNEV
eukprot:TRINITY_DN11921_c0_g1_i2.p1 TRINITY_DN11921_c0_g1~~TRINITY_DN11921_c0_g1_i2.p1  ORF type:complete len:142 (+),score=24.35 TRINITY_DN11921_c0_g1_i2:118-543(+)